MRYEVRYIIGQEDDIFANVTTIESDTREEAIAIAKDIASEPSNHMIVVWQIGTTSGDPNTGIILNL